MNCKLHRALLLILSFVLILSCGRGKTGPAHESESDFPEEIVETDNSLSEAPALNRSAVLYMDCSGSMKGYLGTKQDPKFNGVVSALLNRMSSRAYFFDVNDNTKKEKPIAEFKALLTTEKHRIEWKDESNLKAMIESMVNVVNTGSAGIAYLVTDGIMSGSNAQIKTYEHLSHVTSEAMMSEVSSVVKTCKPGLSILVVKYLSKFTGKYYNYKNDSSNLEEVLRPFYVIAIGERTLIKELQFDVEKEDSSNPLRDSKGVLLLGDDYPYNLNTTVRRQTGIISDNGQIRIGAKSFRYTDTVSVVGSTIPLPAYMRNKDYFKKNALVMCQLNQNGEFTELAKDSYSIGADEKSFTLGITAGRLRGNSLIMKLKFELPSWVYTTSTDDDSTVDLIPRTFNFKYLVQGLSGINKDEYITKVDTLKFYK
ncbi:MAG: hypothetical protein ACI3Y8_09760 [Candidatus Cryptobacteroides sp.]